MMVQQNMMSSGRIFLDFYMNDILNKALAKRVSVWILTIRIYKSVKSIFRPFIQKKNFGINLWSQFCIEKPLPEWERRKAMQLRETTENERNISKRLSRTP